MTSVTVTWKKLNIDGCVVFTDDQNTQWHTIHSGGGCYKKIRVLKSYSPSTERLVLNVLSTRNPDYSKKSLEKLEDTSKFFNLEFNLWKQIQPGPDSPFPEVLFLVCYQGKSCRRFGFVTKFREEGDLKLYIRNSDIIDPPTLFYGKTKFLVHSILLQLAAMHDLKILHKDLKPDNILLETDPSGKPAVKFIDIGFGVIDPTDPAKLADAFSTKGAALYIAPELKCTDVDMTSDPYKIDVFSIGVTLIQLIDNRAVALHVGEKRRQLVNKKINRSDYFEACRGQLNQHVDPLSEIIVKMIETDPANRITSREALEMFESVNQASRTGPE